MIHRLTNNFYFPCFLALLLLASCTNQPEAAIPAKKVLAIKAKNAHPPVEESAVPGTISFPEYELKIYGAFAFVPENNEASLISTDSGKQYVVLDIAVENLTSYLSIDIGQILLSAKVTDEKGNLYPRNPLAIQAYQMIFPDQNQKAEYKAMKGKLRPGKYYRTTAYGFEAPTNVRNFLLTVDEGDEYHKLQATRFSVD
ncbi:MAG TPA: hypothetical protein VFT06_02615 [Flavisolibacter sp.]|nr:hypothetical protein [Flavisolibacter sp.]